MTTERTTYDVRVLGTIWMPSVQAAVHQTLTLDQLADEIRDNPEPTVTLDAIQQWCDTHLGNFASIDALDVRCVEVRGDFESFTRDGGRVEIVQRETTFTQLQSFSDEDEVTWDRCMFPEYEDV